MKTKHVLIIAFLSAVIGSVLGPIFWGLTPTYTYDNDTPAVGSAPGLGYAYIQEIKKANQERMNVSHYWPLTGTQVGTSGVAGNIGEHRFVDFYGPITTPTHATNKGWLYIKDDVDDKAELHWLDEDGNEKQITSAGILKVVAGDYDADSIDQDDIRLANDSYLTARNVAGDGDIDLIKANASDIAVVPDDTANATSAAPTADASLANKKYVDDQITAALPDDDAFGAWASRNKTTVYEAASDGFVVVNYTSATTDSDILGYTNSSSPPTTVRCRLTTNSLNNPKSVSFTMPVKKGDFYKVTASAGTPTIFWVPIGG